MDTGILLILDFGGNQAYYTARRLRGEEFYCEILPGDTSPEEIRARAPRGIVLAGGSYEDPLPEMRFSPEEAGVPILCLGATVRLLAERIGAEPTGPALCNDKDFVQFTPCALFAELTENDRYFERIEGYRLPEGYEAIARTPSGSVPAFGCLQRHIYGLQFYVESNDPDGLQILQNFAEGICACPRDWRIENIAPRQIENVRREMGGRRVLIPVSGGVDSTVTAALLSRAIGNRLSCLLIDTGLLRKGDAVRTQQVFREELGIDLVTVDASERFAKALRGIDDPARKRRVLSEEYSAVFTEELIRMGDRDCVALGTIYPDLLRGKPPIVRNLLDGCRVYEPLRLLFKEEVRALGRYLGVPEAIVQQPSFEDSGLASRCMGEVTPERLAMLREADAIFREEVEKAGYGRRIAQYFAVLIDIRTPGKNGMGSVCVLRALGPSGAGVANASKLPYDLMDEVVTRITTTVPGINHVVYDITGRPTASVEWE